MVHSFEVVSMGQNFLKISNENNEKCVELQELLEKLIIFKLKGFY